MLLLNEECIHHRPSRVQKNLKNEKTLTHNQIFRPLKYSAVAALYLRGLPCPHRKGKKGNSDGAEG